MADPPTPQVYATLDDLAVFGTGVEGDEFDVTPDATKLRYLRYASSKARSLAISKRFNGPIAGWQDDLTQAVCAIAVAEFFRVRGVNATGSAKAIFDEGKAALAWLTDVGNGDADLDGVTDATPDVDEAGAYVTSDDTRGRWARCGVDYDIAKG